MNLGWRAIVLCLWCSVLTAGAGGVVRQETIADLRAHQSYPAGVRVRSPFLGISFLVPADWRAYTPAASGLVLLDSTVYAGLGVVLLLSQVSERDLIDRLNEPQALEEASVLYPHGLLGHHGSSATRSYHSAENSGHAAVVPGPDQRGVMYLVLGPPEQAEQYQRMVEALVASTRFMSADPLSRLRDWYGHLSGLKVTRVSTERRPARQTLHTSDAWHFCPDGRYYELHTHRIQSEDEGGHVSTEGQEGESGSWRLDVDGERVFVVLTTTQGLSRAYTVHRDGDELYLDNAVVEAGRSEQCG